MPSKSFYWNDIAVDLWLASCITGLSYIMFSLIVMFGQLFLTANKRDSFAVPILPQALWGIMFVYEFRLLRSARSRRPRKASSSASDSRGRKTLDRHESDVSRQVQQLVAVRRAHAAILAATDDVLLAWMVHTAEASDCATAVVATCEDESVVATACWDEPVWDVVPMTATPQPERMDSIV